MTDPTPEEMVDAAGLTYMKIVGGYSKTAMRGAIATALRTLAEAYRTDTSLLGAGGPDDLAARVEHPAEEAQQ